jgi:ribonuclease P protein component
VVRNKVRRRIREIARREIDPEAGPVDMVFRANPRAATMDFESIYEAFTRQLRKAKLLDRPRKQQWTGEG